MFRVQGLGFGNLKGEAKLPGKQGYQGSIVTTSAADMVVSQDKGTRI